MLVNTDRQWERIIALWRRNHSGNPPRTLQQEMLARREYNRAQHRKVTK